MTKEKKAAITQLCVYLGISIKQYPAIRKSIPAVIPVEASSA